MRKKTVFILIAMAAFFLVNANLQAHCQMPCGIYNDSMRLDMLAEHITTIEKAVREIKKLTNSVPVQYNQAVRWIMYKEKHAEDIDLIVTHYFMAQRIKPATDKPEARKKYLQQLELLHRLLLHSMKAKQTADLQAVKDLRLTLDQFRAVYTGKHSHSH